MARLVKTQDRDGRYFYRGKEVVATAELAKYTAKRAGVSQEKTYRVIVAMAEIIIELMLQGYLVMIQDFGSFFLRKIAMPSYSLRKKKTTGYKTRWSFSFRKPKAVSKMINEKMRELYPEEIEDTEPRIESEED